MKKIDITNTAIVNYITDGVDGISYETIYKSLATYQPSLPAPSSVDADGAVPDGWSRDPTGVTQNLPYEYCCKRSKSNGVWGQWSTPKVSARWSQDGTSLNIKGNAITIEIGDVVDVKSVYEEDPTTTEKGDAILISAIHESDGHYIMYRVEEYWDDEREAYSHFIVEQVAEGEGYIINAKESVPTDYDGHVFVATEYHDDFGNLFYWQDLGYLKGVDGDNGEDAVVYELVPDVNVINANADGTITTGAINIAAYRVEGSQRSVDILLNGEVGYVAQFAVDSGSWQDCTHEMASRRSWRTYIPAASVQTATSRIRLRLLDGNNAVCGVCPNITIVRNGGKGDKGRMFYLAGIFDPAKIYRRDDNVCPVVYYEPNANTKEYWYLDAATNEDSQGYSVPPSDTAGNPWKKAENFGLVITEALFANFGKLGAWVFHNQYQISQYGVDGTTNYTQFTDENGNWKPVTLLNALSGLAWFGGGKIRFNPNGSGQLAGGNISWDANGGISIANGSTLFNVNGSGQLAGGKINWDSEGNVDFNGRTKTPFHEPTSTWEQLTNGCIKIMTQAQANAGISLPVWSSLDGLEVDIVNLSGYNTFITAAGGTGTIKHGWDNVSSIKLGYKGLVCRLKAVLVDEYVVWMIVNSSDFYEETIDGYRVAVSSDFMKYGGRVNGSVFFNNGVYFPGSILVGNVTVGGSSHGRMLLWRGPGTIRDMWNYFYNNSRYIEYTDGFSDSSEQMHMFIFDETLSLGGRQGAWFEIGKQRIG